MSHMTTSPSTDRAVVALLGLGAKGEALHRTPVVTRHGVPHDLDEGAAPSPVVSVRDALEAGVAVERVQVAVAVRSDELVHVVAGRVDPTLVGPDVTTGLAVAHQVHLLDLVVGVLQGLGD